MQTKSFADKETHMGQLALVCHDQRLATVFDQATELKLFNIENNKIYPAGHLSLPFRDLMGKISFIKSCGVDILICGAISGCAHNMLKEQDILLIPWISGDIDSVIKAFQKQKLDELYMPGCSKHIDAAKCRQRRRGNRQSHNWRTK
ncbi:MAG: NifB/NifX family molybdenum-iron cluster-binding protein [Thermodesulfobacteriota bacterium]